MRHINLKLTVACMGVVAVLATGALIAYSQLRSTGADIASQAFEAARTPKYQPVVALVNGVEIRGEAVTLLVAGAAESMRSMPQLAEVTGAELPTAQEVLQALIDNELAYQEAKDRGLVCSQDDVRRLAEGQVALTDPEVKEAWATYLGVASDQLLSNQTVLEGYAKSCALGALRAEITPVELTGDVEALQRIWGEFKTSLRADAEIEILEPSLR